MHRVIIAAKGINEVALRPHKAASIVTSLSGKPLVMDLVYSTYEAKARL